MPVALSLLTLQAVLGALDSVWHHEISERLPLQRSAAAELSLHAFRELLYGFVFLALAWFRWQGLWVVLVAAVLLGEVAVTLAAFVVEDRTRRLPAVERILHTILALNYGAALALLAPVLASWWRLPSEVIRVSHPLSWILTAFGVGVLAWSARNLVAALRLRQPAQWVRDPIAAGSSTTARTLLVSGATGFIGGHLVRRLITRGDKVIVLTHHPHIALDRYGPHVRIVTHPDELENSTRIDAIVNLAGAPILGLPWTRARRRQLLSSRVGTTRALTALMARLANPVRVFVSASAIGFYGVRGDELIDEQGRPAPVFQSELCQDWEAAARCAARLGARLVRLRIGLVLGRDGGALRQLAKPIRFGLGAVLGSGRQWVSWIHIDDLVRLVEFALDTPRASGALNAVAPLPVRQRQFQEAIARTLRRPVWLRIPSFILRAALGEMAQLLVDGQRVVPSRASRLGFVFRHRRLDEAVDDLLGARAFAAPSGQILFNGACPVCRTEMSHYARVCATAHPSLRFIDSTQTPNELASCGLRREHLERRVYLCVADGRILSGMPALRALWSTMPRHRWLARLFDLPVLKPLSVLLYDQAISPGLASWANRRMRHHASRPHA